MATFFGSDTYCITDTGLVDVIVTSPLAIVGQRLLRRWTTPRGALASINDDPDFGWDVNQYVNAKMRPSDIFTAQAALQAEALKDEQIEACTVTVTLVNGALTVDARVETSEGPFTLTLDVRDLTVDAVFDFGNGAA